MEGIHWTIVQRILDRVSKRYLKEQAGRVEHRKILKSGQLDQICEYAMDLHTKALEPRSRVIEKTAEDGTVIRTTEVVEGQGDKGALHTAMAAISLYMRTWGLEVAPASQELADTVAAVVQGMRDRALAHRQAKAIEANGAPEGVVEPDPPGTPGMPEQPGEIQRDDPV